MKPFPILSRRLVFDSPYCPIEKQVVRLPNGECADWFVNISGDAVIVIPVLKNGEILLQKIYKHGAGKVITEFCAGMVDKEETPLQAAKRELREETGYASKKIKKIGEVFANPTGSIMRYHFFVARDCILAGAQCLESAEQISLLPVKNAKEAEKILLSAKTKTSSATLSAWSFFRKI